MQRTFLALRRYDRDGREVHLVKAAESIGRTMARNFSAEAARCSAIGRTMARNFSAEAARCSAFVCMPTFRDLHPDTSLADEMNYCSDRWNVWRYIRVRRFIESSRPR